MSDIVIPGADGDEYRYRYGETPLVEPVKQKPMERMGLNPDAGFRGKLSFVHEVVDELREAVDMDDPDELREIIGRFEQDKEAQVLLRKDDNSLLEFMAEMTEVI